MKNFLREMVVGKSKKKLMCVLFVSAFIFLFLPFNHVSAAGLLSIGTDFIISSFSSLISWILRKLAWPLVSSLVYIGAWMVDVFLNPELYKVVLKDSKAITAGWTTVRDFCNMFYVFFLLIIAFSTILRNNTFSAKNLLPKLVISIFLINFSRVITEVVIDAGQVFLFGLAGWMGSFSGANGKSAGMTGIVKLLRTQFEGADNSDPGTLVILISSIIYTGMLGLLYIMLAGFMLARLVAFVFLIILSPFAFFSLVLPSMKKYESMWWSNLVQNSISGPIFIFFIYVSAVIMQELSSPGALPVIAANNLGFMQQSINYMIMGLIPIAIMWGAIPVSQRIGGFGSKQLIGGTAGLGKVAMGTYVGAKIIAKTGKSSAEWTGRRAGVDGSDVKRTALEGGKLVGEKMQNYGLTKGLGSVVTGKIVLEEAKDAAKRRAEIAEAKKSISSLDDESALTVAKGIENSKLKSNDKLTHENQIKMAALLEHAVEKGADITDRSKVSDAQLAVMATNGIDLKNLSKFDPYAAGKIKAITDKSKTAEQHEKDFLMKLAEGGEFKKLNKSFRENHFADFVDTVDTAQLQNHILRSGPKIRQEYETGADKMVAAAVASGVTAEILKAKKVARMTGNLEISDAERDIRTGQRKDVGGNLIEFGSTGANVAIDTTSVKAATREVTPGAFNGLNKQSKILYVTHIEEPGKLWKLNLKQEKPDTVKDMAQALDNRLNANPADPKTAKIYREAQANEILGRELQRGYSPYRKGQGPY